jgi:hypothetical protein
MTTATMALTELAEKGADIDVLRPMVQCMAQRPMELDVEGRCGAGYDEKSTERLNSRNGYRERAWDSRARSVELKLSDTPFARSKSWRTRASSCLAFRATGFVRSRPSLAGRGPVGGQRRRASWPPSPKAA